MRHASFCSLPKGRTRCTFTQYCCDGCHQVNCGKLVERRRGARDQIVSQGTWLQRVAGIQGVFYVLTGVWPLLDIGSFQAVTGPKVELWLVRTVGMLVIVIGGVLVMAARRNNLGSEITVLA